MGISKIYVLSVVYHLLKVLQQVVRKLSTDSINK